MDQASEYSFLMDPEDFEPSWLDTPIGLSYHCSDIKIHEKGNKTQFEDKVSLLIKEFQVSTTLLVLQFTSGK